MCLKLFKFCGVICQYKRWLHDSGPEKLPRKTLGVLLANEARSVKWLFMWATFVSSLEDLAHKFWVFFTTMHC